MHALVVPLLALLVTLPAPLSFAEVENEAPLVDAGLDQTVTLGATVYLDGTGSRDPDGKISAYQWSINGPGSRTVSPRCAACGTTRFTPSAAGRYTVLLEATDNDGNTRSDTLYITVGTAEPNEPEGPTASLRGPQTPITGSEVVYTATLQAGAAPLETVVWMINGREVAARPVTGSATTETIRHTFTTRARQTVVVRVTDENGLNGTARLPVTPRTAAVSGTAQQHTRRGKRASPRENTGGSSNRHPVVEIEAPEVVDPGAETTLRADARDADGYIAGYEWNTGATAQSFTHSFPAVPGRDIEFTVEAWDNLGLTARNRTTVHVRPAVTISGPDCVDRGSTHAFTARTQSDGDAIRRYDWKNVDQPGPHGRTATRQFDEPPNATVTIAVIVEDEDGATAEATKLVSVCGAELNMNDSSPRIGFLQGAGILQREGDQSVYDRNVFDNPVVIKARTSTAIRFSAQASDPDGGILTYSWSIGGATREGPVNGSAQMKRESGATASFVYYFTFSSNTNISTRFPTRTISLTVTDENGTSVSQTRSIEFLQGTALRGDERTRLTVDKHHPATGEAVNITIHTGDHAPTHSGVGRSFWLHYGDGEQEFVRVKKRSGVWETKRFTHTYEAAGPRTIQVVPTPTENIHEWGDSLTVTVEPGRSYTEYHWTELLGWSDRTVAAEKPGEGYLKRGVHDRTVRTWNETQTILPADSTLLGTDWSYARSLTRQVPDFEYTTATAPPGPEWELYASNVRQEQVIDHWETETFANQEEAAGLGFSYDGTVTKWVNETEYQRDTDRPGEGWQRMFGTGNVEQVGWRYTWVDSQRYANPRWEYTGQSRRDNRVTRTVGHDHDPTPHCHESHLHVRVSSFFDHCHEWHRHGHNHDVRRESDWDYEYKYKIPVKKEISLWSKDTRVQKELYRYKVPIKKRAWVNRYQKQTYDEQTFHVYQKQFRKETVTYEWAKPEVEEKTTVWKPNFEDSIGTVTPHEHRCGEREGHLQDSICEEI